MASFVFPFLIKQTTRDVVKTCLFFTREGSHYSILNPGFQCGKSVQSYKQAQRRAMIPMATPVLFVIVVLLHGHTTLASDPDPLRDFCIANTVSAGSNLPCKNASEATVEDFVFGGIKSPGKFGETGLSSIPVNADVFPGLNTLGVSVVRADFEVGGVNVPHFHPRATEVAFVLEGKIYSGFVDTQNRIFAKVIEKGELMVFPRGLVHFQMNVGDKPATILGSFNSQNPGLQRVPNAIFGSGIKEELLEKAFGLSPEDIAKLRKKFAPDDESS